ncbi:membrane protein [Mangrovimonas yunxiaonensis]|uniref:Membrane protein n=1 Tax=Mangrovimonas yunxiaonensis TaxID=1197477 RepID=A0A084TJE9_9FLAO|nr:hypothetical protein [Mangrovimonas yunxiaonensis]KFB00835.1 membrane protein [Mangrovimonas yunxiaonensis]GGH44140.1 hypothetical protein GCM10011364_16790 [Mangrovimonas yunxiaonensis]
MELYNKLYTDFRQNYTMNIALTIILQSCIGSIAAMYILMNSTQESFQIVQLSLCVIVSMLYNATIFAQLKTKTVFNALILSLVVNVALIIVNVAQLM